MGIYVIGMHRSGTSVLARVVGLLTGFDAHRGAAHDNAEGHWEDPQVNYLLDTMLIRRNHDWASPPLEPLEWSDLDASERTVFQEVLSKMGDKAWVLKDPRLCLALECATSLDQPPAVAIATYRLPTEVASSLERRDDYEFEYGLALWEAYNRQAISQLRSTAIPTVWVSYQRLMDDPTETINRIADHLERHGVPVGHQNRARAVSALNPELRNHAAGEDQLNSLSPEQAQLLALLDGAGKSGVLPDVPLPPMTGWARAILATRGKLQVVERQNRLLKHRLRRLRWAFRAVDGTRRAFGRPTPEDPFD